MPNKETNRGQKQRDHDRRQMPDALEQTAEPDGQFPENAHGTLDDHQPGEIRGAVTIRTARTCHGNESDGARKVGRLRHEARTS